MKKKVIVLILTAIVSTAVFAGCGKEKEETLKVGANVTPHAEILREAGKILEKEGVKLEVVEIEDSVTPNTSLAEGSLVANFFQHQPYLNDFNEKNDTNLVSVGAIHYEPFGIYAGKTKALSDLQDGAIVAVPNNVTNEARALLLLQQAGLITISDDAGLEATVNDITDNPLNLEIKEIAPEQIVRSLPDVDIAVINGNYALEGGLSVEDALEAEADDSLAAETYANVVVVRDEDKDNAQIKKLVEVLQSEEIRQFIQDGYDGAVVPTAK